MNDRQLGRVLRALRKRLGVTQAELGRRARVQRNKISEAERFDFKRVTVPELDRCFSSMDASLRFWAEWKGAALDRLLDEGHALLVGAISSTLGELGWRVEFEVSFSVFGDRGAIDVFAWHERTRSLLVIEIKTELASMDGLLRPLDVKVRLAAEVAFERFGWQAATVSRLLVLPENSASRRAVSRHHEVLDAAFPMRNWDVKRWLADPASDHLSGLLFLSSAQLVGAKRNPSAVRRVRKAGSRSD